MLNRSKGTENPFHIKWSTVGREGCTYVFSGYVWRPSFGNFFSSKDLLKSTKKINPYCDCATIFKEYSMLVMMRMIMLSITLPSSINKVGLGQNVVFWGDFLAQNNISQQCLYTYDLCKTELSLSWNISTEIQYFYIAQQWKTMFDDGYLLPETVNCLHCRAAGW